MAAKEASKALLIFLNNREVLEALEDAERGQLVLALLNYQEYGQLPDFSGAMKMAFLILRKDVDQSLARWEAECARRSAAGKKSAALRAAKNFPETVSCESEYSAAEPVGVSCDLLEQTEDEQFSDKRTEADCSTTEASEADCNTQEASEAVFNSVEQSSAMAANTNTNTNTKSNSKTNTKSKSYSLSSPSASRGRETDFVRFWQAYPRKVGKQAARKAFARVNQPVERLLAALERQRGDPQWQRENGRFIPHPVTWLSQGRWEDEAAAPPADCGLYGVESL